MKILARILALFLIMPVVELFLLLQVDRLIGIWATLGIILFTGLLGSYLAKREGLSVWKRFKERLDSVGVPGQEALDGVIILVSGALLITPGVLTDFVGFIGLIPFTRALVRKAVMKRVKKALDRGTLGFGFTSFDNAAFDPAGMDPAGMPMPEMDHYGEPAWEGRPREAPGYAEQVRPEEVGETSPEGGTRDAASNEEPRALQDRRWPSV